VTHGPLDGASRAHDQARLVGCTAGTCNTVGRLSETLRLICALLLLGAALWSALRRPRLAPEALVACGGALVLLALGAISPRRAASALAAIGPTVAFLAALLVIAEGCRREGLFEAIGTRLAGAAEGPPRRLLAFVFAVATAVTIVLGLDATVVLLTPVVLSAAGAVRRKAGAMRQQAGADRARAPLYACAHIANAGSLLLPVSNLTNLLAFHASRLSFLRFAALMALPSAGALGVEWLAFQGFFATELSGKTAVGAGGGAMSKTAGGGASVVGQLAAADPAELPTSDPADLPTYPLAVVALTLAGFALSSLAGIDPLWVAVAGAAAITAPGLLGRRTSPLRLINAIEPGFLVFVLALAVIVRAASHNGLNSAAHALLPAGQTLPALLAIAGLSALLANVLNNLPATLLLLNVVAGPGQLLAMLIGVNVGPNLTPPGSLATLLWRRVLAGAGVRTSSAEFLRLGVLCVPAGLVICTVALWVALRL
jgi:arsenical pump membrane protein